MSTTAARRAVFDILLRGDRLRNATRGFRRDLCSHWKGALRFLDDWKDVRVEARSDLFVVVFQGVLLDKDELNEARRIRTAGQKRFLLLPDDSPREALPERICRLGIRSAKRVHTPRLEADDLRAFMRRFLVALSLSRTEQTIADAWVEGDKLVVLSPTFERLKVPVASIPKMGGESSQELRSFEIDENGEFIYWPSHDVHMGWPQFEQVVRPQARLRAQQASESFNRRYGKAIRGLREEAGIRQSDVVGLDARTVRRIEQGQTRATANALGKLAAAHGLELGQYLARLADTLSPPRAL